MYKYLAVFSSNVFIQILVALNPCKSVQVYDDHHRYKYHTTHAS